MKAIATLLVGCVFYLVVPVHAGGLNLTNKQKMIAVNVGACAFITAWGIAFWNYGQRSPKIGNEGWFGKDTREGGADKCGHLYSSYVITHGFSYLYQSWGYTREKAALYGALSSLGIMAFTEAGDSFSNYGFSYEDLVMNMVGSCVGYLLYRFPSVQRKIDLRWEYKPDFESSDVFTDYNNSKYLIALKLDGFDSIRNKYLKYLEFHIGYYARGYSNKSPHPSRTIYGAIGINVAKIVKDVFGWNKIGTIFNYYQMPYTYIEAKHNLN